MKSSQDSKLQVGDVYTWDAGPKGIRSGIILEIEYDAEGAIKRVVVSKEKE